MTVLTDDEHQWNVAPVFLTRIVAADTVEASSPNIVRFPTKP